MMIVAQAAALSADLETCKAAFEKTGIDGKQLAGMSDSELDKLAASVGGSRLKGELHLQLQRVKELCEAQVATMRHFEEYAARMQPH